MNYNLQLVGMRLSSNPTASVIDSVNGIDGKLNEMSDGRGYYLAVFTDSDDPFAQERSRVIAQQFDSSGNPIWKAGSPDKIAKFIGKRLPGAIVTRQVEPYQVGDTTQTVYTTVVLGAETIEQAFTRQGHELASDTAPADVQAVDIALATE